MSWTYQWRKYWFVWEKSYLLTYIFFLYNDFGSFLAVFHRLWSMYYINIKSQNWNSGIRSKKLRVSSAEKEDAAVPSASDSIRDEFAECFHPSNLPSLREPFWVCLRPICSPEGRLHVPAPPKKPFSFWDLVTSLFRHLFCCSVEFR